MTKYIVTILMAFPFLSLAILPTLAHSASMEWDMLNGAVVKLYGTGEYDPAVVVAKKALKVAERDFGPNHLNVAQSLSNLADVYSAQGRDAEADPLYKRALAIREKELRSRHIHLAEDPRDEYRGP